jgi:hypothetical protein
VHLRRALLQNGDGAANSAKEPRHQWRVHSEHSDKSVDHPQSPAIRMCNCSVKVEDEKVSIEARLVTGRLTVVGISRHRDAEEPACREAQIGRRLRNSYSDLHSFAPQAGLRFDLVNLMLVRDIRSF